MANKNTDFLNALGNTPRQDKPQPPKPTKTTKTYSDNAKYDDYDSPRPALLQEGDSQF